MKALEYVRRAGARAAQAYANREALALYEQAVGLLPEANVAQRADVLKKLATVTQYLGDADASLRYAESAVDLYEKLGDKRNAVAMHLHIQVLYGWQGGGGRPRGGYPRQRGEGARPPADGPPVSPPR